MVIELLGPTIGSVFRECKQKFTLKTILMITEQMVLVMSVTFRIVAVDSTHTFKKLHTSRH